MKDVLLILAAGLGGYFIYEKFFAQPSQTSTSVAVPPVSTGVIPISSPIPTGIPISPSWGNGVPYALPVQQVPVIQGGMIQPIFKRFNCPEGQYMGSDFTGGQACLPIGAVS